ncbi:fatty acyl-AMP ligase [Kitasatospora viridis]|uniref:Acyl-CoA synthetase (AMP-forming)/AMP-acid ligase II n=1 Tax=Kitasatospora viridis TaxID=281105 RepID=A0A561SFN6_9ACTN|nr:fatty acyl-AMP ligase [Kitasatospora viridis]TWF73648.1 acyl-CoA synthetase (AMP-forming)/AMP-acid ligase II [Kitasatospora viridis]
MTDRVPGAAPSALPSPSEAPSLPEALPSVPAALPSLPEVLARRSAEQPDELAYAFLRNGEEVAETLTYRQLDLRARQVAARLTALGLGGRSVVLLHPSGLGFVADLLGCMYAGVAAAPVQVPSRARGLDRLRKIADDAGTTVLLTTPEVKRDLEERFGTLPELAGLTLHDPDSLAAAAERQAPEVLAGWQPRPIGAQELALLQYTSGSTGTPKGVRVTHANFGSNVDETDRLWPTRGDARVVNWLPLFHDMGMLFGVVLPLWSGIPSYLMAPDAFVRRPARWLEAISRFRGTHAAAPSFAYELCARAVADGDFAPGLDLSSWRVAANGAEPVRWQTIRSFERALAPAGFRPEAMCPGYGLAENTLKATGSPEDRLPTVLWLSAEELRAGRAVEAPAPDAEAADTEADTESEAGSAVVPSIGCGGVVGDSLVRIVDPQTRATLTDGRVGEIWVSGPCVAAGYHGRDEESEQTFRARRADRAEQRSWLRTGDLGFWHREELFVTGRIKDVVIRQGRNFYPQDIELSAENADPGLHPNCAAAFSADDGSAERLVLVVEADGRTLRGGGEQLRERIRRAVQESQRLEADEIVLVRRGSLPKTSSGKVQRRETRRRYLDGEFGAAQAAAPRERVEAGR